MGRVVVAHRLVGLARIHLEGSGTNGMDEDAAMGTALLEARGEVTDSDARQPAPDSPTSDLDLVRRAQQDPSAFGAVFDRYHRDVYLYCLRRLGSHHAADDAAANVFMKAYAAIGRFKPERGKAGVTFRSWLFSIAHNVVIDAWRRERHHVSIEASQAVAGDRFVDPAMSPEDLALGAEETRLVLALLDRLPDRQRSVVELRLAGLATQEVANALGMSLPAAKSTQFRAYNTLRELLRANPGAISREVPQ